MLSILFPDENTVAADIMIYSEITQKDFQEARHRESFLRHLDSVRGLSAKMSQTSFRVMIEVMKVFLDACESNMDIPAGNTSKCCYCFIAHLILLFTIS